jgi:hypothetical protein
MSVEDVVACFGLPEAPSNAPIKKSDISNWISYGDLDVLGAVFAFLSKPQHASRVAPPLSLDEWVEFTVAYFTRCLEQDKESDWVHGRYAAAWDVAAQFRFLVSRLPQSQEQVKKFKSWLAGLYKSADPPLRECLINGVFEHVVDDRRCARELKDWMADELLAGALRRARTPESD